MEEKDSWREPASLSCGKIGRLIYALRGLAMLAFPDDHRPWPCPAGRFLMHMTWSDLAFLHWPVDCRELQSHLPTGVEVDTHDGQAWLALVPFGMSGVRPRGWPNLPWVSTFLELNLRTYVVVDGKPALVHFSRCIETVAWKIARVLL